MTAATPPDPLDPALGLDDLLALARQRYDVTFEAVAAGDLRLEVLQLADMDAHVERLAARTPAGTPLELPLWARLWPASLLLGYYVQRLPAQGRTLLEVGAGVGLAGLAAAAQGFSATITDNHPDALLFSRINVLRNNLQERAVVQRADFTSDRLGRRFDVILGAEVLYRDDQHRPLLKFLLAHLRDAPEAEVILAREHQHKATRFFKLAEREFHHQSSKAGLKADPNAGGDKHLLCIHRMRAKKHAAA